jgi:hypothetical protein
MSTKFWPAWPYPTQDPFIRSWYVKWSSPVQIRGYFNIQGSYGCPYDIYVVNAIPFTRYDTRITCATNQWTDGVYNCPFTMTGTYMVVMPIDGVEPGLLEIYEWRAWSTKDIA